MKEKEDFMPEHYPAHSTPHTPHQSELTATNISYSVGEKQILDDVSVGFRAGQVSMIIGPNGSGKTTLLKALTGELAKTTGEVHYGNERLTRATAKNLARVRAVVSQQSEIAFPLTVEEVMMMGRYPHFAATPTAKDKRICADILERMDLSAFANRNYLTLSGGERQRVQFSRALAQISGVENAYLLLDEPTSYLDLKYQHEFLSIAREQANAGSVVIAVMHDLTLAAQYGDYCVAMDDGKIVAEGAPVAVITSKLLSDVYGVNSTSLSTPELSYPIFITSAIRS
jgi:iron complex transport system ATP-binding protein